MAVIDISSEAPVAILILYWGLTTGWHVGKGMTAFEKRRQDGDHLFDIIKGLIWKVTHHYDLGVGIAAIGLGLILGFPKPVEAYGLMLFGFGAGMAYDDREDHPPDGMISYIFNQARNRIEK